MIHKLVLNKNHFMLLKQWFLKLTIFNKAERIADGQFKFEKEEKIVCVL